MKNQPGKLLRLYLSEQDQYHGKPLYEAVVARCQELHLAGVTVFRGLEGFGESSEMHRQRWFGRDQPILITVIESPEKAQKVLPVLQEMMPGGVVAVTDVEVMVVAHGKASTLSPSS